MASAYTVRVLSIATDGTNLFFEIQVSDGTTTQPIICPTFEVGTSAADITAYLQAIANNRPTLTNDISNLAGTIVTAA